MFEIGDKVIYQGADKSAYKRTGVVRAIEEKDGKPQLTVELDGGETFTAPIDDWSRKFSNACTSTNSVVRNAMEARFATPVKNAKRVARNADYTDATNRLRFCLDSLYKADDYRNEAVRTVAQLINEGIVDKSAASKMNELQKLFAQAMAVGKDLYYNKLRP